MSASSAPSFHATAAQHVHAQGEHCPWCEQPIPHEKFAEITRKIEAREREKFAEVTRALKEQHSREKMQAETKAKTDLEEARSASVAEVARLSSEAAAKEAAARTEERAAAEARLQAKVAEIERNGAATQASFAEKLATAEQSRKLAERAGEELKTQLADLNEVKTREIDKLKAQHAAAETAARVDERAKAQAQITEAQQRGQAAEAALQSNKELQDATLNARLAEQREALEKAKTTALNAKDSKHFEETQKLTTKFSELQRQLEKKTADELGEGAEVDLLEALREEFSEDRIEQLTKREGGADIKHHIRIGGKEVGIIVYNSKNRNAWRDEFLDKLARDQRAAKAEYAILSTRKFPARAGNQQLYVEDSVIMANAARVISLIHIIRKHVLHVNTLRLSATERAKKTAALYDFITSPRCTQLLDAIDKHAQDLLDMQQKEIKAHQASWNQQGILLRSIQKVRGDIGREIDQIIGVVEVGP